jgi:hypothetical protein
MSGISAQSLSLKAKESASVTMGSIPNIPAPAPHLIACCLVGMSLMTITGRLTFLTEDAQVDTSSDVVHLQLRFLNKDYAMCQTRNDVLFNRSNHLSCLTRS